MSDLGPEARSILGAGRDGDDPKASDRARVRRKLARAIAAGGAAAGAAAEGSAAAATAVAGKTATLLLLGKIGGGLVFVAALGAGIWFSRPLPPGPAPSASVPVTEPASPATAAPPAPSAAADSPSPEAPAAEPPAAAAPEAPAPAPASPGRAGASARPSASAGDAPPRDPLVDETQELREAHGALQSGDPQKALKLLDEQATTYAGGQLREEREAARVLALCKLGKQDEARAKIADFLRDHPGSPLEGRVRGGCPAAPSP